MKPSANPYNREIVGFSPKTTHTLLCDIRPANNGALNLKITKNQPWFCQELPASLFWEQQQAQRKASNLCVKNHKSAAVEGKLRDICRVRLLDAFRLYCWPAAVFVCILQVLLLIQSAATGTVGLPFGGREGSSPLPPQHKKTSGGIQVPKSPLDLPLALCHEWGRLTKLGILAQVTLWLSKSPDSPVLVHAISIDEAVVSSGDIFLQFHAFYWF